MIWRFAENPTRTQIDNHDAALVIALTIRFWHSNKRSGLNQGQLQRWVELPLEARPGIRRFPNGAEGLIDRWRIVLDVMPGARLTDELLQAGRHCSGERRISFKSFTGTPRSPSAETEVNGRQHLGLKCRSRLYLPETWIFSTRLAFGHHFQ